MDRAERELLQTTVRDAITVSHDSHRVDEALTELGWVEMLESEPDDGIAVVFSALGTVNATATVLDDVVGTALGGAAPDVAMLLPSFARWGPPGTFDGVTAQATGLTTERAQSAAEMVVVCHRDRETWRIVVPRSAVELSPVRGIDPDLGLHLARVAHPADDATVLDAAAWGTAVAAGQRAIAHQMAGACRAMLALAVAHAVDRVQFDRPIARFQAVRHRLAEALVAVEALEASVAAADDEAGPMTAALAKVVAGRSAGTVAAHCQQVLAGTGFTTEHAFHHFLRRTMALAGLFGSADELALDLGRQVLATRAVPTLIEL